MNNEWPVRMKYRTESCRQDIDENRRVSIRFYNTLTNKYSVTNSNGSN